jgi:hypothetical protein
MTNSQSAYYRGVVIPSIMKWLNIDLTLYKTVAPKIHTAIKHCFGIRSMRDLSVQQFEVFAETLRMLFVREYGLLIPTPDEKDFDAEKATMREYLRFKRKHNDY